MTRMERDAIVEEAINGMINFVEQQNSAIDAGTLVRDYCRYNNIDPRSAEIALLYLINQGILEANQDLQLHKRAVENA